jgi:ribosomal protein L11 methyltransferase
MNRTMRDRILDLVTHHCARITPSDLKRRMRRDFPSGTAHEWRTALRHLIDTGAVVYTNHFNTTHIELGHTRPIRVSKRILISPSNCLFQTDDREVVIKLNDGAAFGNGDHPTSRLMLQGIDWAMAASPKVLADGMSKAIDIGTGNGILSIAAANLGVSRIIAVDTDPLARVEANYNINLNRVQDRVVIVEDVNAAAITKNYDFIFANLRPPTLLALFQRMLAVSVPEGVWVLSGFRAGGHRFIQKGLAGAGYAVIWQSETCGWGAVALKLKN